MKKQKLLYRKVNTKARNVDHNFGGDFKYSRNKKRDSLEKTKGSMHGVKQRGIDYTPLFKFLLSKKGLSWDKVFSEAKTKLDKTEPIFWLVSLNENDKEDIVKIGESSYFSGMYVDDFGILQLSNPYLKINDLKHYCKCCTHTFNGKVY